jgi:hypothetical protein
MRFFDLCELFYRDIVGPALHARFPELPYAAAVLGRGSEILGLDDETSRDHAWGPHVMLFFSEEDAARSGQAVQEKLSRGGAGPRDG